MIAKPVSGYAPHKRVCYCSTCTANTSSVALCPFCSGPVDADNDPRCPNCKDRVAPVFVCHQCGEERSFEGKRSPVEGDEAPRCQQCHDPIYSPPDSYEGISPLHPTCAMRLRIVDVAAGLRPIPKVMP